MDFIKKISDFFNNVSLELDTETENEFTDYILDSDKGLNKINISEHDKSSIINWKLNEFKKYLKFGDGFEKKQINLDLFKDWEKKNQRNFDDWCNESNNDIFWYNKHGNNWKEFKDKFEKDVKELKFK